MKLYFQTFLWIIATFSCDSMCAGDCINRMNEYFTFGNYTLCERCIYNDQCVEGLKCAPYVQRCENKVGRTRCPKDLRDPNCACPFTERGIMTPRECKCMIWFPNYWVVDFHNYENDIGQIYVPETLIDGGISAGDEFAQAMLCAHNFFRTVNFTVSNDIPLLKWNSNLSRFAQERAEYQSKDCRKRGSSSYLRGNIKGYSGFAGETIYLKLNEPVSSKRAIDATVEWYNGIRYYQYSEERHNVCERRNKMRSTSAFLQVMWAKTLEIGCGIANCSETLGVIVTCEYGPRGNSGRQQAFSKQTQEALDNWSYNMQFDGLPTC